MDQVLEFLKGFNLQTILSLAIIAWYFSLGVRQEAKEIKESISTLDHDIRSMNTRISRIEGTVYGREIYNKIEDEEK